MTSVEAQIANTIEAEEEDGDADLHRFAAAASAPVERGDAETSDDDDDEGEEVDVIHVNWHKRKTMSRKDQWEMRFRELSAYYQDTGHRDLSAKYSPNCHLYPWVCTQRQQYRLLRQDCASSEKSRMTKERRERLESIGFRWQAEHCQHPHPHTAHPHPHTAGGGQSNEDRWELRFRQLKSYKEAKGNCDVPRSYPGLGGWVSSQRTRYRFLQQGRTPTDTALEQFKRLESIGFRWSLLRKGPQPKTKLPIDKDGGGEQHLKLNGPAAPDPNDDQWELRFRQLLAYKRATGNLNVPARYLADPGLGFWASKQRRQYRLVLRGCTSPKPVTLERMRRLESIGFQWSLRERRGSRHGHEEVRKYTNDDGGNDFDEGTLAPEDEYVMSSNVDDSLGGDVDQSKCGQESMHWRGGPEPLPCSQLPYSDGTKSREKGSGSISKEATQAGKGEATSTPPRRHDEAMAALVSPAKYEGIDDEVVGMAAGDDDEDLVDQDLIEGFDSMDE